MTNERQATDTRSLWATALPTLSPFFTNMFQRVVLESWHSLVPYIAFALVAGSFLMILFRVITMKREEADTMAQMPLEKSQPKHSDPGSQA